MSVSDPRLRNSLPPHSSDALAKKREAVLRVAEHHFTAAEFADLVADLASGKLDVRLYDDGIVLMRKY